MYEYSSSMRKINCCQQRMERCSVLTGKSLRKQAETLILGSKSNVHSHRASNSHKPSHWAFLNNNINNIKIILFKLDVGGDR